MNYAAGRSLVSRVVAYAILVALSVVFFFPFYWMVKTSFEHEMDAYSAPPAFLPMNPTLDNFSTVLARIPFMHQLGNTVIIALLSAVGILVSCSMVAYSITKVDWPGRNILLVVTLSVLLIPFAVYMIPLYVVYRRIHFLGSLLPLWGPAWFGNAFYIYLLVQFMRSVPDELSHAAWIDGCTHRQIFRIVVLPLMQTALTLVFILQVVGAWKDYLGPLIYLTNQRLFTLSVGITMLLGGTMKQPWTVVMAGATMVSLPLLVIFAAAQRWFMEGIAMSGLKG